jgi:sterol desaturase/sphingolipid hydroxylase (fatty acid hydroxylase superfamily)
MPRKQKSEPGYVLNEAQRNIFLKRILPTLFSGSIIWLVAELVFSYTFQNIVLSGLFLLIYIVAIIGEVGLFIAIYFLSKYDKKVISLLLY